MKPVACVERRVADTRPGAIVYLMKVPAEPLDADSAVLAPDELRRAERFHFPQDRAASVTARAAARRRLGALLDMDPADVPIELDADGRPRVADPLRDGIDFNVSHTRTCVAVAVACGQRVGVDVESHRADRGLRDLVPEVMGVREREMLASLDGEDFVRAFYACWTRKEAIVKGLGVGIAYPLHAIDIPVVPSEGFVRLPATPASGHPGIWTLRTLEVPDDATVSVALEGAGGSISVVEA